MTLLRVESLSVNFPIYGGFLKRKVGEIQAVKDVSFSIIKGETLGIVGESGCGKTTLGRAIVRLYDSTSGKIWFQDKDITKSSDDELRSRRRQMQIIFQDPYSSLNPRINVRAILEEPLLLAGQKDESSRLNRVFELMDLVGLRRDGLHRYPHEFSGGQRQRIGIARAIALNPELVVCDEAVSALDVSIQAQVINLLADLQKKLGLTYIFVAHDLAVVQYISDRIAVMYLGRIVEIGGSQELYKNPMHPYTKALISSIPAVHPLDKRKLQPLAGDVPSPSRPPAGCAFHPRCSFATAECKSLEPKPRTLAGRVVACHHAERLAWGGVK
ncbi:MAG: ABC transporter ATP-binding protein [Proteobacteria bacterium]|nr:ABC transporter ATP-binding protein [Pseudomonadota bacterium]